MNMSAEAEVETMAMPSSSGAQKSNVDFMGARSPGGADVRIEAMGMATPSSAEAQKATMPVLDLLHWSETPSPKPSRARFSATNDSSAFMNASDERPFLQPPVRSEVRTSQPAGGVSTISFGENLTLEESDQLQKRRPTSDSKKKEMIGSRIFEQETAPETPAPLHPAKIPVAVAGGATPQQASSVANTEFLDLSSKKPCSFSEVAKQRELSGTLFGVTDTPGGRRPCSSAKSRELEGSNIFGRSNQEQFNAVSPKGFATDFSKAAGANYKENYALPRTSVKVSNPAGGRSQVLLGCDAEQPQLRMQSKKQDHSQKVAELSGHNVLKADENIASRINQDNTINPCERMVSDAKRKELIGNDIFSDTNPVISMQDRPRRARQPPGGESDLKLF